MEPKPTYPKGSYFRHLSGTPKPRIYLAGPIRISPHDFKERFACAENALRANGFAVFNPVNQDDMLEGAGVPLEIRVLLKHDLNWICDWASCVGLLDGWDKSTGVLAEFWTATACGIPTWHLPAEYQL